MNFSFRELRENTPSVKGSGGIRTVRNFGVKMNAEETKFTFMSRLGSVGQNHNVVSPPRGPEYTLSIVTRLQAGRSVVRIPAGDRQSYLLQNGQAGSGSHPAFYLIGTGGSFPGNKAAGA
jgi:hypothetical protein